MSKLILIETTRYSELFRRVLSEYSVGVEIEIGSKRYRSADIPRLLAEWCVNAEICRTQHFRLSRDGIRLFSFHDHPRELFAALSELPFIEKLHADRILRYRVAGKHEPFGFFKWVRRLFEKPH